MIMRALLKRKVACTYMTGLPGTLYQTKKVRFKNVYICSEWKVRDNG